MSQTVADLLNAAMALPAAERAELAELLAATVDAPTRQLHPAWAAEIRRRAAEVESGAVQPIPLSKSLDQVRQLLAQSGPRHG